MFKLNVCKPLIALAITAAVAACGGGGGGGSSAGSGAAAPVAAASACAIPASAVASIGGLLAFLNQLIDTATNETSEPLALCDVTLPVDDTA